jgi:hypothetical protein
MTVLSVGMHNQQHDGRLGLHVNRADRLPTVLPRFAYAVQTYETAFVFEGQRRQCTWLSVAIPPSRIFCG